jgi:hypothetical protein
MNAVSPFREHLVDGGVVDQGGAVARSGYWHALPLHTRIEDLQSQIEDAVIAQLHFGPRVGIDRCGKINAMNSGPESCTGIGVVAGLFVILLIREQPREKHERPSP